MLGYRLLETVSLIYASLPCLLFMLGWLKPVFALPLAAVLSAGVFFSVRQSGQMPDSTAGPGDDPPNGSQTARVFRYLLIALMVAFVVAYSGIGGYSFQISDYSKHNAFFRDLIENSWPLGYQQTGPDNKPGTLNTYFGYYLPPAAVGRVVGWTAAQHFSYVWATLGVFLTVLWFLRFVGRPSPLYALLFLFFGGLDILGQVVTIGWPLDGSTGELDGWIVAFAVGKGHEVMNDVFSMFCSNLTVLGGGQHHLLPVWICMFMLLHDAVQRRSAHRLLFLWALTPLNSAFFAVGMAPYVLLSLYETRLKKVVSFPNLVAAPLLLLVSGLYLTSNNGAFVRGWLWEFQDIRRSWPHLLLCYVVEFGLYVLCCPLLRQPSNKSWRIWWYTSIGCMLLLPWYRIGQYCDFTTKAALASLLVFQACLAVALRTARVQKDMASVKALVCLLFLGSFAAIGLMAQAFEYGFDTRPRNGHNLMRIDELEPKDGAAQLFSDGNSFFWRVLARPVVLREPEPLFSAAAWDFALTVPREWHWLFACKSVEQTPEGAVLHELHSGPLLRLRNVAFKASDVAAISLKMSAYRVDDPQRKPVKFATGIFWASERDLTEQNRDWPFGDSPGQYFQKFTQGYMAWVSESHSWRGTIRDLCINVYLPDNEEYEICVSRIQFMRR